MTNRLPAGLPYTAVAHSWPRFQSSVTSWSSRTISDGTVANTLRASGRPARKPTGGVAQLVPSGFVEPGGRIDVAGTDVAPRRQGSGPQGVGPGQQVAGEELPEGPQVVGGGAGGEPEALGRRLPPGHRRQGPEHPRLVDADEIGRDAPDAGCHRRGHLVGVQLVARVDEEVGPARAGAHPVGDHRAGVGQAVESAAVDLPAGGVEDDHVLDGGRRGREGRQRGADAQRQPVRLGPSRRAEAVLVDLAGGEGTARGIAGDHRQPQRRADPDRRRRSRRDLARRLPGGAEMQGDG